jgi:hypothetical protein
MIVITITAVFSELQVCAGKQRKQSCFSKTFLVGGSAILLACQSGRGRAEGQLKALAFQCIHARLCSPFPGVWASFHIRTAHFLNHLLKKNCSLYYFDIPMLCSWLSGINVHLPRCMLETAANGATSLWAVFSSGTGSIRFPRFVCATSAGLTLPHVRRPGSFHR